MTTLLIATHNPHKVVEIREILGSQFQFLTLNDFPDAPRIVEDADTFNDNAAKKAVELAKWINLKHRTSNIEHPTPNFVLADDSGLEVDALNGEPGVHSARFAAMDSSKTENSSTAENNAKLLRLLKNVPMEKRSARFHCVIALAKVQSPPVFAALRRGKKPKAQSSQLFDGVCEGKIILEPRGQSGFGYDPLFVPDGFKQTFAELGEAVKNKLSHRAKALEQLRIYLNKLSR